VYAKVWPSSRVSEREPSTSWSETFALFIEGDIFENDLIAEGAFPSLLEVASIYTATIHTLYEGLATTYSGAATVALLFSVPKRDIRR
jgi:hypothetical protein